MYYPKKTDIFTIKKRDTLQKINVIIYKKKEKLTPKVQFKGTILNTIKHHLLSQDYYEQIKISTANHSHFNGGSINSK